MSEHEYTPKSKVGKWFNDRLPLLTLANHLTDYPTPKNLNYWWTFGGILTCLLYTSPSPRDVEESRMPSSA